MTLRHLAACAALVAAGCGRFGFDDTPDAAVPPDAADLVAAQLVEVATFSTASPTFVMVPGSTISLPIAPGRRWLLLTSAALGSTSGAGVTVEARYVVDGVEHGIGGTQNSIADRPGPWLHADVIDGEMPHEIHYELRDAAGTTATISQLHAVAIPLLDDRVRFAFSDAPQNVIATTSSPHTTLSLGALSGDYVFLLVANSTDLPDLSDVYVGWRGPGDEVWQQDVQHPREGWQAYLTVQRATVDDADATITFYSRVGGDTSQVSYVRAIAIRTDAFASVDFGRDDTPQTSAALAATTAVELLPPASSATDHVIVGQLMMEEPCTPDPDAERTFHLITDTRAEAVAHATDNCSYAASYGAVRRLSTRPSRVEVGFSTQNSSPVSYLGAQLLLLGLP